MKDKDRDLRLASYNLRKCIGLDRRRDPGRSLDVLNSIGADIIALQEADRRLGHRPAALPREMIERGSDFVPLELGANSASLGWHGNAILLRKGLEAGDIRCLDLPGLEPRGAVMATIGGLRVIGLHLGLMRRHRREQLAAIADMLAGLETRPTVILGDFNEWSARQGFEPITGDFRLHAPGLSYHSAAPLAPLDRFALGPGIELRDAGVVQTPQARRASDHLPVWADIRAPADFGQKPHPQQRAATAGERAATAPGAGTGEAPARGASFR